jgi:hypothetical protein
MTVSRRRAYAAAAAVVATATLSAVAIVALADDGAPDHAQPEAPTGPCHSDVRETVLPEWARYGFSDPSPTVPHVMGEHGQIVAILFGGTLHSPPLREVNNKILWVSLTSAGDSLRIDAVREGTTRHVIREVPGGPGPSTINLPAPGCWRVQLRWGDGADQRDSLDLEYAHRRS